MTTPETPSQTAGPYVHIGLAPRAAGFDLYEEELGTRVFGDDATGERIVVEGRVIDGGGDALTDVLIEVWQADGAGRFAQGTAEGWGRIVPDFATGLWRLETVKPGPLGGAAPHIALWIVARGINLGLHTRIYFDDEGANATDPVLDVAGARRGTLIASRSADGVYRHDIVLQGDKETVFLDV